MSGSLGRPDARAHFGLYAASPKAGSHLDLGGLTCLLQRFTAAGYATGLLEEE